MYDRSHINNKIIGLCYITDAESQKLHSLWSKRFQEQNTLLMDVDVSEDVESIAKKVSNQALEKGFNPGENCIITSFLGFHEPARELSEKSTAVVEKVVWYTGLTMNLHLQFAYLGAWKYADRNTLCENISSLCKINIGNQTIRPVLCLIGKQQENSEFGRMWDSVFALLALLRRSSNPNDDLPAPPDGISTNDVAFLRFMEYNEAEHKKVNDIISEMNRALGTEGAGELKAELRRFYDGIEKELREKFVFDGRLIPLPQTLKVEGFFARRKAKKGKNQEFEAAKRATVSAICESGDLLKNAIMEYVQAHWGNGEEWMERLCSKANIGLGLKKNTETMHNIFEPDQPYTGIPRHPSLKYCPDMTESVVNEADTYLECCRANAIKNGVNMVSRAILAAYDEIPQSKYKELETELTDRLMEAKGQERKLIPEQQLFLSVENGEKMETVFNPAQAGGGTTGKYIIFHGKKADAEVREQEYDCSNKLYFIEDSANLQYKSWGPTLALQMLSFDFSEERLNDLLS